MFLELQCTNHRPPPVRRGEVARSVTISTEESLYYARCLTAVRTVQANPTYSLDPVTPWRRTVAPSGVCAFVPLAVM